jgi:hypothetical protein
VDDARGRRSRRTAGVRRRCQITLAVQHSAGRRGFGVMLDGPAAPWLDDVERDVPPR